MQGVTQIKRTLPVWVVGRVSAPSGEELLPVITRATSVSLALRGRASVMSLLVSYHTVCVYIHLCERKQSVCVCVCVRECLFQRVFV